jgi:formate hydrogenlyase subunit 3/multisubunit Na+/H+ antiporter MnhD subunit
LTFCSAISRKLSLFCIILESLLLIAPVLLSLFILVVPGRMRFYYTLVLLLVVALVTSAMAGRLWLDQSNILTWRIEISGGELTFTLDGLSAFFVLVTNFTTLTGLIFAAKYLKGYEDRMTPFRISLHYFAYVWLCFSMLAVLTLQDGLAFLVAWELMGVASFLLILFEADKLTTLKTAVNYLVQMHIGLVLILIGFLVAEKETHIFGFAALKPFFEENPGWPLALLLIAGFGIKAGFVPLHTWLPEAHPAAPSHVSGVMSGVMIKLGFYGIFRVVAAMTSGQTQTGAILLIVGALTGLYGIMQSVSQTDLKRMLAYSTIENVGIIGMGMGLGTIGLGTGSHVLVLLGFGGALLHILNHSLFKSLLFYAAGSVYKATHTRNMEELGGLVHRMPYSTTLFLTGSAAICALPPLNGFISEVLIYYGLFAGLQLNSFYLTLLMTLAILSLSLIGGLAIFGFARGSGITFLGTSRSALPEISRERKATRFFPEFMIVAVMVMVGLAPSLFVVPVFGIAGALFGVSDASVLLPLLPALQKISLVSLMLIGFTGALALVRKLRGTDRRTVAGPVWGCGYTAGTSKQQYTASSFSAPLTELANPLLRTRAEFSPPGSEELFPETRTFRILLRDVFITLSDRITLFSRMTLRNMARLQTGHIQHYILYSFVFMLLIFGLLYLNLI